MAIQNCKHAPIMPIPAKSSQYGVDPALVKKRVAELPGMCSIKLTDLFPDLPPLSIPADRTHWIGSMKWQKRSCARWICL